VSAPTGFDGPARPTEANPAPALGAHTDALLAECGYPPAAIADLRARGII